MGNPSFFFAQSPRSAERKPFSKTGFPSISEKSRKLTKLQLKCFRVEIRRVPPTLGPLQKKRREVQKKIPNSQRRMESGGFCREPFWGVKRSVEQKELSRKGGRCENHIGAPGKSRRQWESPGLGYQGRRRRKGVEKELPWGGFFVGGETKNQGRGGRKF